MSKRVRARELDLPLGRFKPGKFNSITDVEGVLVGHSTIIEGAPGPLAAVTWSWAPISARPRSTMARG